MKLLKKYLHFVPFAIISITPFLSLSFSSNTQQNQFENLKTNLDVNKQLLSSKYVLDNISTQDNLQSWDINESKGEKDMLNSNKFFSDELGYLGKFNQSIWKDSNANGNFHATKTKVTFRNTTTNEKDSFYIYFNSATRGTSENYGLVALEPLDESHIVHHLHHGAHIYYSAPTIFGKPIALYNILSEVENTNIHLDENFPYFLTYHEVNNNFENNNLNYKIDIANSLPNQIYDLAQNEGVFYGVPREIIQNVYYFLNYSYDSEYQNASTLSYQLSDSDSLPYKDNSNDDVSINGHDILWTDRKNSTSYLVEGTKTILANAIEVIEE